MSSTARRSSHIFDVNLDFFSGPMDLLLHLVSQQEVAIEQVKMAIIAEQYLAVVLEQADNIDIEKASEYLVIAATLLALKSSSLLPAENVDAAEVSELNEMSRFFETLRDRIREFQKTKLRAEALMSMPQLGLHSFTRIDKKALRPTPEMLAEPEDGLELGKIFSSLMKRIGGAAKSLRILAEPVSVVGFMMKFIDRLSDPKNLISIGDLSKNGGSFLSLLGQIIGVKKIRTLQEKAEVRSSIVAGFVAVLELAKRGVVFVKQETSDIQMVLGLDPDMADGAIEHLASAKSLHTHNSAEELEEVALAEGKLVRMADFKNANLAVDKKKEVGNG